MDGNPQSAKLSDSPQILCSLTVIAFYSRPQLILHQLQLNFIPVSV